MTADVTGPIHANEVVGRDDILFVTIDSLRYDVAVDAMAAGLTPNLARWLSEGWERRHTPASFTLAAHAAFFAGFLPTPADPDEARRHKRLFAVAFPGSKTTGRGTCVFDTPDIVAGLAGRGYHTVCIGGTAFFNPATPLGLTLPALFAESHWRPSFGVQDRQSPTNQVQAAIDAIEPRPPTDRLFLFVNLSATHSPTHIFRPEGPRRDSRDSQCAALVAVDAALPPLIDTLRSRSGLLLLIGSDHGEAFGEDGYRGHRLGHEAVWTVPWAEVLLPQSEGTA